MATEETFATRADPVLVTMPDRCRIAARVLGPDDAPPVLFVAGGDGGMSQWRGLLPELCVDADERALFAAGWTSGADEGGQARPLAADLRVVVYDARGTGWSSRAHGVCTTAGQAAADALALMGALVGRGFHLVGHGLGVAAALQLALAAGRLVSSLTLISGTAGGDGFVPPGQEFFTVRAALASAMDRLREDGEAAERREDGDGPSRRTGGAELVELGFAPRFAAANQALVDHLAGEALRDLLWELELGRRGAAGPSAAAGRGEQFAGHDVVARLPELATPTLVICGDADAVLPPGNSEALAGRIAGARLVTLDAGHQVTVERAAEVAAALRAHALLHP
jgi:pimeloyl-ACP methyl ester carboxylesterase